MANNGKNEKNEKGIAEAQVVSKNKEKTGNQPSVEEALGAVTWLLVRSTSHKHLFLTDFEWLVLPPIQLMQFRIFRDNKRPLGYVSWALVDQAVEQRLLQGVTKLAPKDWRSGDRLWVVDVVAPFGGAHKMLEEIQQRVFKDREAKILQPKPDAKGVEAKSLKTFLESLKKSDKPEVVA
jgi:cytolysin-activating lysine-acyltransferase